MNNKIYLYDGGETPKGYYRDRSGRFIVMNGYHLEGDRAIQDGYHLEGDQAVKNGFHVTDSGKVIDNKHYENLHGKVLSNGTYESPYTGRVLNVPIKPKMFPIFSLLFGTAGCGLAGFIGYSKYLSGSFFIGDLIFDAVVCAIIGGSAYLGLSCLGRVFGWAKKHNSDKCLYALSLLTARNDYRTYLESEYCSDEEYERELSAYDKSVGITDEIILLAHFNGNKEKINKAINSGEAKEIIEYTRHPKTYVSPSKITKMPESVKPVQTQKPVQTVRTNSNSSNNIPEYLRRQKSVNTTTSESVIDIDKMVDDFMSNITIDQIPVLFTNYVNALNNGNDNEFIRLLLSTMYTKLCETGLIANVEPSIISLYFTNKPKVKVK